MFVVFVSTCVTVNFIYFFCRHFKNPVRKPSEFRAGLCDPARLFTNQIACFTVVII